MFGSFENFVSWADDYGTIIDLIIYLIPFLLTWKIVLKGQSMSKGNIIVAYSCVFLFFVFSFWGGDWFHYYYYITDESYASYVEHLEAFYLILADRVNNDYLLWRCVIWGSSLLLIIITTWRLKLNTSRFLAFFTAVALMPLSVGRVTLSMAVAFLGYSYIIRPMGNLKWLSYVVAGVLVISSPYFHKSGVMYIALIPLSFVKLEKKTIMPLFLSIPLVIIFLKVIGIYSLIGNFFDNDISEKLSEYSSGGVELAQGPVEAIIDLIFYIYVLLTLYIIIKAVNLKEYYAWPKSVRFWGNIVFWIFLFAFILIFVGASSTTTFIRMVQMNSIPIAIFLCSISENSKLYSIVQTDYKLFASYTLLKLNKWWIVPLLSLIYHG